MKEVIGLIPFHNLIFFIPMNTPHCITEDQVYAYLGNDMFNRFEGLEQHRIRESIRKMVEAFNKHLTNTAIIDDEPIEHFDTGLYATREDNACESARFFCIDRVAKVQMGQSIQKEYKSYPSVAAVEKYWPGAIDRGILDNPEWRRKVGGEWRNGKIFQRLLIAFKNLFVLNGAFDIYMSPVPTPKERVAVALDMGMFCLSGSLERLVEKEQSQKPPSLMLVWDGNDAKGFLGNEGKPLFTSLREIVRATFGKYFGDQPEPYLSFIEVLTDAYTEDLKQSKASIEEFWRLGIAATDRAYFEPKHWHKPKNEDAV